MTRRSVLIVDDDPDAREIAKFLLDDLPATFDVFEVGHGADALAFLRGQGDHRDLAIGSRIHVLLDINMPIMNGFEFLDHLEAAIAAGEIVFDPVVVTMFTSSQYPDDVARATAHDVVTGYVYKYPSDEELADALAVDLIDP